MNIRPSAAIRNNYNEIAELCRSTGEPVYLTKNGSGDLVVMDIVSFERREKMLDLRAKLLQVEEDRLNGAKDYTRLKRAFSTSAIFSLFFCQHSQKPCKLLYFKTIMLVYSMII